MTKTGGHARQGKTDEEVVRIRRQGFAPGLLVQFSLIRFLSFPNLSKVSGFKISLSNNLGWGSNLGKLCEQSNNCPIIIKHDSDLKFTALRRNLRSYVD